MRNTALTIGKLAARAGVSTKAIRFYEAEGVLPPPLRSANGYRLYAPDAVDLLWFLKQAQGLSLNLAKIKEIVAIRQGGRPPCRHVYRLLQEKARELEQKLADLIALRRRIRRSLAQWGQSPRVKATVCPHIEAHATAASARKSGGRSVR